MSAVPLNDGGPAFPGTEENGLNSGWPGMDLRDYFAAKALPGYFSDGGGHDKQERAAIWAYKMADAMLNARAAPIPAAPDLLAAANAALDDVDAMRAEGHEEPTWAPALRAAIAKGSAA